MNDGTIKIGTEIDQSGAKSDIKKTVQIVDSGTASIKKSFAEMAAESGKSVEELKNQAKKLAEEYQRQGLSIPSAYKKAYDDMGVYSDSAARKMEKDAKDASAEISQQSDKAKSSVTADAEEIAKKSKKEADESADSWDKSFTDLKSKAAAMSAAAIADIAAVAAAIGGLAVQGIKYNIQMENYVANFTTMLGSEEAAVSKVNELKKLGASTPFEMSDLASATTTLLAFGIQAEDSTSILTMLGDVSLGNSQKLDTLSTAYGNATSQGKLTGETCQQMIEAGFNPLKIIAEQTGESMSTLTDRMSDGGISADELTGAFKIATSEGGQFYKGMETASKTTDGMISTLKDNANSLLGEVLEPISNEIKTKWLPDTIKSVDKFSKAFDENGMEGLIDEVKKVYPALSPIIDLVELASENGQTLISVIAGLVAAIVAYKAVVFATTAIQEVSNVLSVAAAYKTGGETAAKLALTGATGSATVAQAGLNAVMAANPIGLVVTLIAGLVTALGTYAAISLDSTKTNDAVVESSNNLVSSVTASKQAYDETVASAETSAAAASNLATELYDLNGVENKSAEQKKKMVTISDQLNDLYPDMNLSIDAQTGLLNKNKESVDNLIESQLEEAKVAGAQERLVELYTEQLELESQIEEQSKSTADAQTAAADEVSGSFASLAANSVTSLLGGETAVDSYENQASALNDLSDQYAINSASIQDLEAYVTESTELMTDANGNLVASEQETTELTAEELEEQLATRQANQEALEQSIQDHYDEMGTIEQNGIEQNKLTAAQAQANWEQQIADEMDYLDQIESLSSRVPDALLSYLETLGPSYTTLITDLNAMTDEELQSWVDTWESKGTIAEVAASDTFAAIYAAYGDPYETFYTLGEQSIAGLVESLRANSPGAYTAASEAAKGIAAAYAKTMDIHSPSVVMAKLGYQTFSPLKTEAEKVNDQLTTDIFDFPSSIASDFTSQIRQPALSKTAETSQSSAIINQINTGISTIDYDALAAANAKALEGMTVEADGEVIGHVVTKYVDQNLGSADTAAERGA